MSQKRANKRKKLPIREKKQVKIHTSDQPLWHNLPPQFLGQIAKNQSLKQNITSVGCVFKSWRPPSKNCHPNGYTNPQLVEILLNKEGRVQAKGYMCSIPGWNMNIPFKLATLSSHPNEWRYMQIVLWDGRSIGVYSPFRSSFPCFKMAITSISRPAFAFYKWESEHEWIFDDCKVKDPYSNPLRNMAFCNAIGFQGKFYALSLQGCLAVIEWDIDGSCFRIMSLGRKRAVPSKSARQFREYLMECDGKILLIFLVSRKTIGVVDDVEVFELDVSRLLWMKADSLEGRTLFLGEEYWMWVRACEIGCKRDFIYFTHHRVKENEWFLYDIGTGQICSPASGDHNIMWDCV